MNIKLYPDAPVLSSPVILKSVSPDKYFAMTKLDGFNCQIHIGENTREITTWSKVGKHLPVSPKVKEAIAYLFNQGKLPHNSIIWGEWMKVRGGSLSSKFDGPECIAFFSPYYLAGEFVGHLTHKARFDWILGLGLPVDDITVPNDRMKDEPLMVPAHSRDFVNFFEFNKKVSRSEGIVLYQDNGTLSGSSRDNIDNRTMQKFRYRSGDDGRTQIA
jgi:hypothetical protein